MVAQNQTLHLIGCNCAACTGQSLSSSAITSNQNLTLTTQHLAVSGDTAGYIKSLLGNNAYLWGTGGAGTSAFGHAVSINYTFGSPSWANPYNYSGAQAFDATHTNAALEAMNMWSNVCNVTFHEGTTNNSLLAYHVYDLSPGVAGETALWGYNDGTIARAEVAMDVAQGSYFDGGYGLMAIEHEIGHALGLKHPGNYNAGGGGASGPYLTDYGLTDSHDFTIMSYYAGVYTANESTNNPMTAMLYDVAAVQKLYGANTSYNSGDTTYTLASNSGIFTRWDGAGTDTLNSSGYNSNVTLDLREGASDVTSVGNSHSWNAFGANIENATAGGGNDTLYGNALANVLDGGNGNDTLWGFGGNDMLKGGAGNDTYQFSGNGDGTDTIIDASGTDCLVIDGITLNGTANNVGGSYVLTDSSVQFNLSTSANGLSIWRNGCSTHVLISAFNSGMFGIDVGPATDVYGNASINKINVTLDDSNVYGLAGNDTLTATGANTTLYGGDGNDTITASGAGSTLDGGANDDKLTASGANSTLTGGDGNDTLIASAAGGTLDGGAGNDKITVTGANATVSGGAGIDTISLGATGATVNGEGDNDTITIGATAGGASVNGGDGNDKITSSIAAGTGAVTMHGGNGDDTLSASSSTVGHTIYGDDGNDTITGSKGNDTLDGGAGNDTIVGSGGNDTIHGGEGNNIISVASGTTTIDAGAGNDTISGGSGSDTIDGGNGTNTLNGNAGDDNITGGTGVDTINGGMGNDTIHAGGGNDIIVGGGGNDTIYGEDGDDTISVASGTASLYGGNGNDTITGGTGADTIDGGAGNNTLIGNAGNDTLIGGSGSNIILGGAGADTIQLASNSTADTVRMSALTEGAAKNAVTGYDNVTGFESGTDHFNFGPAIKTAWDDIGAANNALAFATDSAVNFNTTHEAWLCTGFNDGDLTQAGWATMLAALNAKGVTATTGADGLIAVESDSHTALFSYMESGGKGANSIAATELTLLAVVNGHLAATDFGFYA